MKWTDDEAAEEGMSIGFIAFIIVTILIIMIILLDYYSIFFIRDRVNKDLKRTVNEVVIKEIKDKQSIDRELTVNDINTLKSNIESEALSIIHEQHNLDLENINTEIDEKPGEKRIFVKITGKVKIKPLSAKGIRIPLPVKGRGKGQRLDIEENIFYPMP